MASRTAAANALMRHKEEKAAAHGQPEPPPTASFEQRPPHCNSAAPSAKERAAPQLAEQVCRVGCELAPGAFQGVDNTPVFGKHDFYGTHSASAFPLSPRPAPQSSPPPVDGMGKKKRKKKKGQQQPKAELCEVWLALAGSAL